MTIWNPNRQLFCVCVCAPLVFCTTCECGTDFGCHFDLSLKFCNMPSTSLGYFYDHHRRPKLTDHKSQGAQEPRLGCLAPPIIIYIYIFFFLFLVLVFGSGLGLKPHRVWAEKKSASSCCLKWIWTETNTQSWNKNENTNRGSIKNRYSARKKALVVGEGGIYMMHVMRFLTGLDTKIQTQNK